MQLSNILRKRLTSDYQTRSKLSYLAIVRGNAKDYCGFYWDSACIRWDLEKHTGKRGWDDLQATYWRIAELYQRWQRLCRYRAEILPEWKDTGREIHWGDNSVDKEQIDKDGNTRMVQITAPHGDPC